MLLAWLLSFSAHAETYVWFKPWTTPAALVEILRTIPEGRQVLERALKTDPGFLSGIKAGSASFTERELFEAPGADAKERFRLRQRVTIKKSLPLSDAVADFAHELVHFSDRRMPDPYGSDFSLRNFVKAGMEGEGSELAAFATECRVAWQLEKEYPAFPQHALCEMYKTAAGFNTAAARADYYASGKWHKTLPAELRTAMPELNDRAVIFSSGFDQKPYATTLAAEFGRTLHTVCALNQWKRRAILAKVKALKMPDASAYSVELDALAEFEKKKCR